MHKPPYYRLPAAALEDVHLTRAALIVLAVLIDQSDFGPPELTIGEIAEAAGCSRTTVKDSVRQLREAGLIDTERTGRASRYTVREILPPKRRQQPQATPQRRQQPQQRPSSIDMQVVEEIMRGGRTII